ncbi:MAG: hypothetical protein JNN25_03020 [Candidatus Kapabacteria bacterium]|nr:hypothetical protein [Candidatus Kapabacteria bacterium]
MKEKPCTFVGCKPLYYTYKRIKTFRIGFIVSGALEQMLPTVAPNVITMF